MSFKVSENSPTWIKLALGQIGIEPEFNIDDLTPDQHNQLATLKLLHECVDAGELEPFIKDGQLSFKKVNPVGAVA